MKSRPNDQEQMKFAIVGQMWLTQANRSAFILKQANSGNEDCHKKKSKEGSRQEGTNKLWKSKQSLVQCLILRQRSKDRSYRSSPPTKSFSCKITTQKKNWLKRHGQWTNQTRLSQTNNKKTKKKTVIFLSLQRNQMSALLFSF